MLAPAGGAEINFRGAGNVTYVAVKGTRLSLLYPYSNQVLANGRECWTAYAWPKTGAEVEKG